MHTSHDLAYAIPLRIYRADRVSDPQRHGLDRHGVTRRSTWAPRLRELSRMGLRTALEAYHFRNEHCLTPTGDSKRGAEKDPKVVETRQDARHQSERSCPELLEQVAEDPHLAFVSKMMGRVRTGTSRTERTLSRASGLHVAGTVCVATYPFRSGAWRPTAQHPRWHTARVVCVVPTSSRIRCARRGEPAHRG